MRTDTVEIPKQRYYELLEQELWLNCLEDAGVDAWEGISFAYGLLEEIESNEI